MIKKVIFMLIVLSGWSATTFSQGFLKKLKEKAASAGSDLIVKKGTQKAEKVIDGKSDKKNETAAATSGEDDKDEAPDSKSAVKGDPFKSYSKFDFVPGEKIIFAENFEQDAIGEFPLKWFTNGSAEVVTAEGLPGKWLKLVAGRTLTPTVKFPPNFILEYDLLVNMPVDPRRNAIAPFKPWQFQIFDGGDKTLKLSYDGYKLNNMLVFKTSFQQKYAEVMLEATEKKLAKLKSDRSRLDGLGEYYNGGIIHVAMSIQGERLRMWYDAQKVLDVPVAVPLNHNFNQIQFEAMTREGISAFYIANIKLSEGKADTRSKLMDEGRFVTTGIQFDTGSDKIKPVSYGVLKEIATAIKDNSIKVNIIGHTDSDGSADANLGLSKRRAEAVKNALVADFQIAASAIQTDGKGASQPVGDNKTSTGKAQNRRVEFVKL
jgi:OOP family OmpA-OmpF porin